MTEHARGTTVGFTQRVRATTAELLCALLRMYGVCSRTNKHKSRNSCSGTLRLQLSVTHRKRYKIQPDCKLLKRKVLFSNEVAINDQLITSYLALYYFISVMEKGWFKYFFLAFIDKKHRLYREHFDESKCLWAKEGSEEARRVSWCWKLLFCSSQTRAENHWNIRDTKNRTRLSCISRFVLENYHLTPPNGF